MNGIFRLQQFISYQIKAKTKYYIHSPFVYQFYLNVLSAKEPWQLKALTNLRRKLMNDKSAIQIEDYGAGKSGLKTISELENKVAVSSKYGKLLFNLLSHFQPKTVLEIGGSIGISSAYMALAAPEAQIISLEGSTKLIEKAIANHGELGIKNVSFVEGNFDDTLPQVLANYRSIDMIHFDGNHNSEATLKYFEWCIPKVKAKTIFVFDDIYWSPDMKNAWDKIKADKRVPLTIDVFQYGLCFFIEQKLAKEDFVLRY